MQMHRQLICHHSDWGLYELAFGAAMEIFECSQAFPPEEKNTLIDPLRKSSRTLCALLAQAWRKRLDDRILRTKLDEAETLAAETQSWLEFALRCGYLEATEANRLIHQYGQIMGKIVWLMPVVPLVDR